MFYLFVFLKSNFNHLISKTPEVHPAYGDDWKLPCCIHEDIHLSYPIHYDVPPGANATMLNYMESRWNTATQKTLFCGASCRHTVNTQGILSNGRNQVSYGAINIDLGVPSNQVLAVTGLWEECLRPNTPLAFCTDGFRIVEWDVVFNTADHTFSWIKLLGMLIFILFYLFLNSYFSSDHDARIWTRNRIG